MTTISDHWIARNPAAVGSQSPPGPYHGSAAAYGPEDRLHTLVANAAKQADALRVAVESEKAPPREALIALAAALHRRGDSAAALRFAAQALALVPEDPAALRPYALIRFPSVEAARESVRMVPGDPVLLTILGEALRLAGRTGEAGEVFARAIDADPDVPDGYINLGVLHANRGERVEAIRRFRQALAIDPGNQAARSNWKLATQSAPSRR
jgi:Flp pilus assembly protein TadD